MAKIDELFNTIQKRGFPVQYRSEKEGDKMTFYWYISPVMLDTEISKIDPSHEIPEEMEGKMELWLNLIDKK